MHDGVAPCRGTRAASTLVVMGGDHSITAPSVEAFASIRGSVGLVQLDAHMDLRNLEDGGPTNGTPIRQLLESGTIEGHNIVQVGLHPFANARAYRALAESAGITQITATEVAASDSADCRGRALDMAGNGTERMYVTLDMDVLDAGIRSRGAGPGTGRNHVEAAFGNDAIARSDPRVRALDIVEVDPTQDPRRATVSVAVYAMLHVPDGSGAPTGSEMTSETRCDRTRWQLAHDKPGRRRRASRRAGIGKRSGSRAHGAIERRGRSRGRGQRSRVRRDDGLREALRRSRFRTSDWRSCR